MAIQNITMLVESVDKAWAEILAQAPDHYAESESMPLPLELDYGQYKLLEDLGTLVPYIVRDNGVMVGYAWFIFHTATHHRGVHFASNDSLYLRPDYRHGALSGRIIDALERDLKTRGAEVIVYSMRPGKEYSTLLGSRGYGPLETQWGKVVKDPR
jgi:hypothetical protein